MKAGAFDFIEKPFSDQILLDRIRAAIAKDVAARQDLEACAAIAARIAQLTPRERDVMSRVVAGKSNKLIATELKLATKTVEAHRARVMEKLQANSLAELIRYALMLGETEYPPIKPR